MIPLSEEEENQRGWLNLITETQHHIVPVNDIAYHTCSIYCACRPEFVNFIEGYIPTIRHNAFDFRDLIEKGIPVEDVLEPLENLPRGYDMIYFTSREQ